MSNLIHCGRCRSFPCNCWQTQWQCGPDPGESYREGFARGFEAAKERCVGIVSQYADEQRPNSSSGPDGYAMERIDAANAIERRIREVPQ